jgi:LPS-assembly lipoprotein
MSLSERGKTSAAPLLRRLAVSALVASAALTASACTVRPLYSDAPLSAASQVGAREELASIAVKPVNTRYAQQVRNNLIFGLTGGAGEPANPAYTLDLAVVERIEATMMTQTQTDEDEPTAGTVTLIAAYTLTDVKTRRAVATGRRSISASFDRPRQEFASYRAERDAENRAARELAELLRLAVAQDLARRP